MLLGELPGDAPWGDISPSVILGSRVTSAAGFFGLRGIVLVTEGLHFASAVAGVGRLWIVEDPRRRACGRLAHGVLAAAP